MHRERILRLPKGHVAACRQLHAGRDQNVPSSHSIWAVARQIVFQCKLPSKNQQPFTTNWSYWTQWICSTVPRGTGRREEVSILQESGPVTLLVSVSKFVKENSSISSDLLVLICSSALGGPMFHLFGLHISSFSPANCFAYNTISA